jgi:hypothetical protein
VIFGADGKPLRRAIGFSRGLEPASTYNDDGPDLIGKWEETSQGDVSEEAAGRAGGAEDVPRSAVKVRPTGLG